MFLKVAEARERLITELAGVGGALGDAYSEGQLGVGHVGGGVGGGAGAGGRGLALGAPRGSCLCPQGVCNSTDNSYDSEEELRHSSQDLGKEGEREKIICLEVVDFREATGSGPPGRGGRQPRLYSPLQSQRRGQPGHLRRASRHILFSNQIKLTLFTNE